MSGARVPEYMRTAMRHVKAEPLDALRDDGIRLFEVIGPMGARAFRNSSRHALRGRASLRYRMMACPTTGTSG
jgi:hypothetical protein